MTTQLTEAEARWVRGRWWRVTAPDGSLWCETSDEDEARAAVREGDRLERLWVAEGQVWAPADYPLGDGPSYAFDIQPLEDELALAAEHPEYGIDVPAVEAALAEARADAGRAEGAP